MKRKKRNIGRRIHMKDRELNKKMEKSAKESAGQKEAKLDYFMFE